VTNPVTTAKPDGQPDKNERMTVITPACALMVTAAVGAARPLEATSPMHATWSCGPWSHQSGLLSPRSVRLLATFSLRWLQGRPRAQRSATSSAQDPSS
jgi:hypothetical protein